MTEIKKPGTFDEGTPSFINNSSIKDNTKEPRVKAGTKEHVILSALVDGRSLTRFDAIPLHDTCLNSTISTLQSKGIRIHRVFEKVPCVHGTKKTDVCRYSLTPDQVPIAMELLGVMS